MRPIARDPFSHLINLAQRSCRMSSHNVATLKRIDAEDLRDLLLSSKSSTVAVVDVRDDDHVGGHIRGSLHVPMSSLDWRTPEIIRKLASKQVVVFHCALSQQRGPTAALRYLRERQEKADKGQLPDGVAVAEGEHTCEGQRSGSEKPAQEVYVLDRGFVGWQHKYGRDERLTEAYAPDIWEDE